MRQLHVVALSEDGRSVLLATSKAAKTGSFTLSLDARLAAALRGDVPRVGEQHARDFDVTPKEIQARLRAGESPEQIANAAGVPVARVERFAGPVLSERERIIDEARAGYLSRNRRGVSQLPLGDAVDGALAETSGLRPESVAWSARRLESGHWLVQLSYVARARSRSASWVFEPHTRSVTASDPASAALGHVGDGPAPRRLAVRVGGSKASSTAPVKAAKPAKRAAGKVGKKAAKKVARPAAKKAAKPAAKKVAKKVGPKAVKPAAKKVAKKVGPKAVRPAAKKVGTAAPRQAGKTTAPRSAGKTAAKTAPAPGAKKVTAKKVTTKKATAGKATAGKATARKATTSRPKVSASKPAARKPGRAAVKWGGPVEPTSGPPTLRVVPQPAPEPAQEPPVQEVPAAAPKRRAAGERAQVPDWADVLLGIAPKRSDD